MSIILRNTESGISDSSIFLISYSAQDAILSVYLALIVLCFLRNMSAERLKRLNLAQDAILSKNNLIISWILDLLNLPDFLFCSRCHLERLSCLNSTLLLTEYERWAPKKTQFGSRCHLEQKQSDQIWIMGLWLCWDGGSEGHVCPSDGEGRDGGSHLLNERFRKAVRRTEPPTAGWIVHRTKFNE